ncbi:MAG: flagellar basal body-associated FliL family protein [Gemmatimonadaceae bacterium]|nr:flagellar basal body-associated FliL family protein [Acetobacteraceae bacterium]
MAAAAITADAGMGVAPKKGGKKKLIVIAAAVLLLAGGGAAAFVMGVIPGTSKPAETKPTEAKASVAPVFLDLPDIIANLNAGPRRTAFIKLKAKFELSRPEDQAILQAAMPRVLDLFQTYLREMRPEELRGTAGTYRLREELIARTNIAAHPARVLNVLFTELLVQ